MSGEGVANSSETDCSKLLESGLPDIYGYLLHRVRDRAVAQDLTSETVESAFVMMRRGAVAKPTVGWLIGIARHKLIDHWRRQAVEERRLAAVADRSVAPETEITRFDVSRAGEVLALLNPWQRAALTARYVDGLSVPETAELLGRTVAATENLLVRAKRAFRAHYGEWGDVDD